MTENEKAREATERAKRMAEKYVHASEMHRMACEREIIELLKWWDETVGTPDESPPIDAPVDAPMDELIDAPMDVTMDAPAESMDGESHGFHETTVQETPTPHRRKRRP